MPERPAVAFGVAVPHGASLEELRARTAKADAAGWAACLALGYRPEQEALDLLLELTRAPDWSLRNLAVQGIGRHALGAQASDAVIRSLSDPAGQVVRTALDAIGALRVEAARPRLRELLSDADPQRRLHAVRALAELWTDDSYSDVLRISKQDKTEFVRREAERTLRRTATDRTWRRLFDRWKLEKPPRLRVWACELLGDFGSAEDLLALRRLVRDGNSHVREAAEAVAARRGFQVGFSGRRGPA